MSYNRNYMDQNVYGRRRVNVGNPNEYNQGNNSTSNQNENSVMLNMNHSGMKNVHMNNTGMNMNHTNTNQMNHISTSSPLGVNGIGSRIPLSQQVLENESSSMMNYDTGLEGSISSPYSNKINQFSNEPSRTPVASQFVSAHPLLGNKKKIETPSISTNVPGKLGGVVPSTMGVSQQGKFNAINTNRFHMNNTNTQFNHIDGINNRTMMNNNTVTYNRQVHNQLNQVPNIPNYFQQNQINYKEADPPEEDEEEKERVEYMMNTKSRIEPIPNNARNVQFLNEITKEKLTPQNSNTRQVYDRTHENPIDQSRNIGNQMNTGEYKGLVKNFFETITTNTDTNNEINNFVKQKVANIVLTEIEKKIDVTDESFISSKLQILRQYFDVTHSYVVNKILFILVPYVYIHKALYESRTYYVYAHLKKKMEGNQQGKHFNANMSNNKAYSVPTNEMHPYKDQGYRDKMNISHMDRMKHDRILRNNSNDISYVDYSNISLFKADLYIPLMSIITYILLYTLTITAQKNNFSFNPDNLFNISFYVFLLIFFETVLVKFLFLIICRDINVSFLHIMSFISYKFVIMCALIITKIFYYFIYFMYISLTHKDPDGTTLFFTPGDTKNQIKPLPTSGTPVLKNTNHNLSFNFSLQNIILFLNSSTTYRFTQMYFYITVSVQMMQIFKSIHLYVHDNSNLLNSDHIRRINILIIIFSILQIFLCWILTPSFS